MSGKWGETGWSRKKIWGPRKLKNWNILQKIAMVWTHMGSDSLPKKAFEWEETGKRPRGRLQGRWADQI